MSFTFEYLIIFDYLATPIINMNIIAPANFDMPQQICVYYCMHEMIDSQHSIYVCICTLENTTTSDISHCNVASVHQLYSEICTLKYISVMYLDLLQRHQYNYLLNLTNNAANLDINNYCVYY